MRLWVCVGEGEGFLGWVGQCVGMCGEGMWGLFESALFPRHTAHMVRS
jgi:hypothetical protein